MKSRNFLANVGGLFVKLWVALKSHPVELLVLLHAATAVVVKTSPTFLEPAPYALFATVAAFCLSFHRHRSGWWMAAYWAVLPLYALTALLPDAWHQSTEFFMLCALMPLVYLIARGTVADERFSARFFGMVRSYVIAIGIAVILMVLLFLIYESVALLFLKKYFEVYPYIFSFCFVLLAPMLFIGLEGTDSDPEGTRLEGALVNYVLTPALLIYNVMLYVYLATIVIRWELPNGSVATMVSAFMVVAVAVKWLRPRLQRQPLQWYFRWFALFALPLVVLYWVAVGYRIGQYGLTIDRCILVAVGAVMSLWTVLDLIRMRHLPFGTAALTVLLGVVLAVGGPLSARQVSLRSQLATVRSHAAKLDLLDADGHLKKTPHNEADTLYRADHRAVYQAMRYVQSDLGDTVALRREFGMTAADYLDGLSTKTADYARAWRPERYEYDYDEEALEPLIHHYISVPDDDSPVDLTGYSRMIAHRYIDKGIPVPGGTVDADEVLEAQLAKIGYSITSNLDGYKLDANSTTLGHYRSADGSVVIVFEYFSIVREGDSNHIADGCVRYALSR